MDMIILKFASIENTNKNNALLTLTETLHGYLNHQILTSEISLYTFLFVIRLTFALDCPTCLHTKLFTQFYSSKKIMYQRIRALTKKAKPSRMPFPITSIISTLL